MAGDQIAVQAGILLEERIHRIVDPRLPPGAEAYYNGSLEISETYNRVTVANTRTFTPPLIVITMAAIYFMFRSIRKTVIAMVAVLASVIWTLGLYSLLGFSFNVLASMIVPLIVVALGVGAWIYLTREKPLDAPAPAPTAAARAQPDRRAQAGAATSPLALANARQCHQSSVSATT